jgi:hypothetical protein
MLCICNAHCKAQNAKHFIIMIALLQLLFKFWSAAARTWHLILAPKSYPAMAAHCTWEEDKVGIKGFG